MHYYNKWKVFLTESVDNRKGYSFDFDSTLIKLKLVKGIDEDGDPYVDLKYDGPHEENLSTLKKLLRDKGNKVYIVTSRNKPTGVRHPHDDTPSPEEFAEEQGLVGKLAGIIYTNGAPKIDTLKKPEMNIVKHWDDDRHELDAIEAYNADNPDNKIEYELVPRNDIPEEINEMIKAKYKKFYAGLAKK